MSVVQRLPPLEKHLKVGHKEFTAASHKSDYTHTMLLNSDSEERKLKDLTLEARHSLCLELAKKRRQSVGASIFIPKDDSKHKMTERCEKSTNILTKCTKDAKQCIGNKLGRISKKKKLKGPQRLLVRQQSQLKHPESFPILRQIVSNEKIRTAVQILRDQNSDDNTQTESEDTMQKSPDMPHLDCTVQTVDDNENSHHSHVPDCEIINETEESPYVILSAKNENIEYSFYTNFEAHKSELVLTTKGKVGEEGVEQSQMTAADPPYVNYVEAQTMNNNVTFLPDYNSCNRVPTTLAYNESQKSTQDQPNFSQEQSAQLYYTPQPTTQRVDVELSHHRPIDHVERIPLYVPGTHDSRTEYNYPVHMNQMHPALVTHRRYNTGYPLPYPHTENHTIDNTTHQMHRQAPMLIQQQHAPTSSQEWPSVLPRITRCHRQAASPSDQLHISKLLQHQQAPPPTAYLQSASMHWTNQRSQEILYQPALYHSHEMPTKYSASLQNAQMYHNFIEPDRRAWYYNTNYTNSEPIPYGLETAAPNLCTPRMPQNVVPPLNLYQRHLRRAQRKAKAKAEHWSSHQSHHNTELLHSQGYHRGHSNGSNILRNTPIDLTIRHEQRYSKLPLHYPDQLQLHAHATQYGSSYPALNHYTLENTRIQGVSTSVPPPNMNANSWHQIYDLNHHDCGSVNSAGIPYQYPHAFERTNLSARQS